MDDKLPFNMFRALLIAFVVIWHEVAKCFDLSADQSFFLTLGLCFGTSIIAAFNIEIAGSSGPVTAAFLSRSFLWILIWLWLAPEFMRSAPFSFNLAGFFLLAFAGSSLRKRLVAEDALIDRQWLNDRSDWVVCVVINVLALCALAYSRWGSVLPLIGYVLLIGLPASIGWLASAPKTKWRYDANFGDEDMFTDVGASDEF